MHPIHINADTTTLYYDCGYDGLLMLSYKNEGMRTFQRVNQLQHAIQPPDDGGFYRPALNDPEILLLEETLQLKRHDQRDAHGARYPAAQLVHNIHEPDKNVTAAHFLDGQPVNYLMRHSYYQRNKDFILQGTRVVNGKIVPLDMPEVKALERLGLN